MIVYIFVNTNNISFKYSRFQNFSENSFKTKTFYQNHTLSYHETTFKISFMVCPFHIIFCLILKKKNITRLNSWKSFLYLYALITHILFVKKE